MYYIEYIFILLWLSNSRLYFLFGLSQLAFIFAAFSRTHHLIIFFLARLILKVMKFPAN